MFDSSTRARRRHSVLFDATRHSMDRNTCDLARASFPLGDGFAAVPDAPRARLGPSERLPPVVASSGPAAWRSPRDGVPRPARVRAPVRGDVLRLLRPEPHGAQPEPNRGLLRVRRRRARRQAGRADLRGVLPARLARDARHRAAVRRRAAQAGARRDARARPGPVPPDRLRDGVLAAVRAARATGIAVGGALPLVYSITGDLFPPTSRAYASATVGICSSLGSMCGQGVAGFMGPTFGWRLPFAAVAAPGLVVAWLVHAFAEEPPRGVAEGKARGEDGHDAGARDGDHGDAAVGDATVGGGDAERFVRGGGRSERARPRFRA